MANIVDTEHEIVGKKLADVRGLEIGTLYPVIDAKQNVIGVFSAEFGTPDGYRLDSKLQAFVRA